MEVDYEVTVDDVIDTTERGFDGLPRSGDPPYLEPDGASDHQIPSSTSSEQAKRPAGALSDFLNTQARGSNGYQYSSISPSPPKAQTPEPDFSRDSAYGRHTVSVNIPPSKFKPLPYATGRSGLVYDVRMRFHEDPFPDNHPEDPRRIAEIFNELIDAGLAPDPKHPDLDSDHQLVRITIRHATEAEISLSHSAEYISWVRGLAGMSFEDLEEAKIPYEKNSIYFNNLTWMCATLSAGGAIEAMKAVVAGQVRNSIAIIRPPGHHAEHDHPEGFCFFNNVCIAARIAQKDYPATIRKVLILDWDVHHGNGIQRDFYSDPNVLYISIHQHENGNFYPHGTYGDHLHCGEGVGLGRNVNVPWSNAHMGDADYIYAFQQVVMPICVEFDPDLVFISAGFDAADGDPIGGCHVTPACYGHMTHLLMQLAKGRVVSCLEGGYNLRSIAKCALSMTRVMMGEPPDRMGEMVPSASAVKDVQRVVRTQARFWRSMYPKQREASRTVRLGSERLHDIIREWQAEKLWKEHGMAELFVLRERLSRSFENQVLATQNFHEARPLLVIFHDPPEAMGFPDPRTNELELHNTWLTDVSKTYLDWAIANDFAAIDVNIPKYITGASDSSEYEESEREAERAEATKDLAFYLWQNYIETSDATHVFLMGMGDAYVGIIGLLSSHGVALATTTLAIGFLTTSPLRALVPTITNDPSSIHQYYSHSLIFVSSEHLAFDPERKPPKRKHGRVIKSECTVLTDMLATHKDEVCMQLEEETKGWKKMVEGRGRKISRAADVALATQVEENTGLAASNGVADDLQVGGSLLM